MDNTASNGVVIIIISEMHRRKRRKTTSTCKCLKVILHASFVIVSVWRWLAPAYCCLMVPRNMRAHSFYIHLKGIELNSARAYGLGRFNPRKHSRCEASFTRLVYFGEEQNDGDRAFVLEKSLDKKRIDWGEE